MLEEHRQLLEQAAAGQLPKRIMEHSTPGFTIFRELIEAGYLTAVNASHTLEGAYLEPRITLDGREYLKKLSGVSQAIIDQSTHFHGPASQSTIAATRRQ